MLAPPPPSASRLLRVEHAVAEALLAAKSAEAAYPALLAAIGEGLDWHYGGLWLPTRRARCTASPTWADERFGRRLTATASRSPPARAAGARGGGEAGVDRRRDGRRELPAPRRGGRGRAARRVRDPAGHDRGRARVPHGSGASARRGPDRHAGQPRPARRPVHRPSRAEAAVHESEARKRAMLDAALDVVITIDCEGRIVEINAAVQDIFGHDPRAPDRPRARRRARPGAPARASPPRPGSGPRRAARPRVEITAPARRRPRDPRRVDDHPDRRPRTSHVHRLRPRHHRPHRPRGRAARPRAASSPPPTRRAGGWSATSTTARRTACWPSAWT